MAGTADPSFERRMRLYLYLIVALGLCLRLVYFSSDIGGSHTFRQAMVANQIDTLKSKPYPGPKLGFLERYDQVYDYGVVFYDTPIYQFVAAKISDVLDISGVRAGRLINLLVYVGISLTFFEILVAIGLGLRASLLAIVLFSLSPLAIQNIIGIYPDTLATLAAYLSFYLLMRYEQKRSWRYFAAALVLGFVCTLIKSSIYVVFIVAYAWNLIWNERWRAYRRIDAMLFGLLIAASVGAFVLERTYFNYGHVLTATEGNYNESLRLSWFLGSEAQRLDPAQWRLVGERLTFEYLFPLFMPVALIGLWRVIRQFIKKPGEPQQTLLGLVLGSFVTLIVFFNVVVIHDYYALPFLPIYCVLTSIGLLYLYSLGGLPVATYPRAYIAFAAAAIFTSLYYAYSLRLLNYNGNNGSVETGKNLQQLVPADGYLFYFHGADYIDPEYLYYARRRGVLYDLVKAENGLVGQIIRDHKWDPDNTYLLALGFRLRPDRQQTLKQELDKYDLKEIGTSYDDGVVYKITPKS
jgi:Dolichyl-phosphate-mannose-protein mannosyltransferase